MAIYHMSMKTVSRSAGRSATAAAAYRAAAEIEDTRTGEVHDYRRRRGVDGTTLLLPAKVPSWAEDRAELWNQAEASERRSNSTVAREIVVALPAELDAESRTTLVHDFAHEIIGRHGCAVDVAIHAPGKQGNHRNHHAHLLMTTRRLEADGFTAKTRELDDRKTGRGEVLHWRERWAELTNTALERAGRSERVDHRTLKAQGIDRAPTTHRGPGATAHERKTQEPSRRQRDDQAAAESKRAAEVETAELDKQAAAIEAQVIDLEAARAAMQERRERQRREVAEILERRQAERDRLSERGPDEAAAEGAGAKLDGSKVTDATEAPRREAQPPPAPPRSSPGDDPAATARARRELARAEREQAILRRVPKGQASAVRTQVVGKLSQERQQRGKRLRERLADAWRRLGERRKAWMEAAPGRLRRLLGGREALDAHEGKGKALERRERDLKRREAVVERETHPQRAHDWALARVGRDLPELTARAEAEHQERVRERRKEAERKRSRECGRDGWGR